MTWTGTRHVYVDEPWLLMRWDPEHHCVFAEWRAFATSAEFRGALTKALAVARDNHAFSFINDTRKLELVTDEDQWWIRNTWAHLVIEAGLKKIAVIMPQYGLSKMAIEHMFHRAAQHRRATVVAKVRRGGGSFDLGKRDLRGQISQDIR
jgi:hypothetical protein